MREIPTAKESDDVQNSARDWHIPLVLNDPEFQADIVNLIEKDGLTEAYDNTAAQIAVAKKWGLHPNNIWMILADKIIRHKLLYRTDNGELSANLRGDEFSINFNKNLKRTELLELYAEFSRYLESIGAEKPDKRKRGPEQTGLLYAIFKARMRGQESGTIFTNYRNGNLEGYSGSKTQFKTQKELVDYYSQYEPQPIQVKI